MQIEVPSQSQMIIIKTHFPTVHKGHVLLGLSLALKLCFWNEWSICHQIFKPS
jgi:hypothetical protein